MSVVYGFPITTRQPDLQHVQLGTLLGPERLLEIATDVVTVTLHLGFLLEFKQKDVEFGAQLNWVIKSVVLMI